MDAVKNSTPFTARYVRANKMTRSETLTKSANSRNELLDHTQEPIGITGAELINEPDRKPDQSGLDRTRLEQALELRNRPPYVFRWIRSTNC